LLSAKGLTLLELLLALALVAIAVGIGFVNFRTLGADVANGAHQLAGGVKQARAKAMATTSAYRLVYLSPTELRAEWSRSCAGEDGWTLDPSFNLELPSNVIIYEIANPLASDVIVCFNSRGLADANPTLRLRDFEGRTAEVEVLIGGAVELR
jgi:prepilin-type N-terminal cleavage/methylation domain-containing protein